MIDRLTKLPLAHQPGTVFEYGFLIDCPARWLKRSASSASANTSPPTCGSRRMRDTTFSPTEAQRPRLTRPFPNDPLTGKPQAIKLLDTATKSDCGGACAFATVGDYVVRKTSSTAASSTASALGPKTVRHMISNHLGPENRKNVANVEGIAAASVSAWSVAVRTSEGLAGSGQPGDFSWNGAYGTQFFADPKERLVLAVGTAAPRTAKYYREQVQDIVYGAMVKRRSSAGSLRDFLADHSSVQQRHNE